MTPNTNIRRILKLIEKAYGNPRAFKATPPIDELIRTVLSQNTNDTNSLAAFAVLKRRFRPWERLLGSPARVIAASIRHAGLANIKAARIKDILKEIRRREGSLNLLRLKELSIGDALSYLRSLKGVGPKTASCVLLFSFGMPAMPVDTHIFRVAGRLGLIGKDMDIEEAHNALAKMVPKDLIYEFHLGIIEHGRRTCHSRNPECRSCILYKICRYGAKA